VRVGQDGAWGQATVRSRRTYDDTGAGTLLAVALLAVVGLVAVMAAGLGGASVAQVRAQGVADLTAVVAAHAARDAWAVRSAAYGTPRACALATTVADANGAELARCGVEPGGVVQVSVCIATAWGNARASARAGPSSAG